MSLITYHSRTTHSSRYYSELIQALIQHLTLHRSDREIAAKLNASAILTASGKPWKFGDVKAALYKIRNYETHPSKLHQAINQLCFDQVLRPAETLVLFALRRENGVM